MKYIILASVAASLLAGCIVITDHAEERDDRRSYSGHDMDYNKDQSNAVKPDA